VKTSAAVLISQPPWQALSTVIEQATHSDHSKAGFPKLGSGDTGGQ